MFSHPPYFTLALVAAQMFASGATCGGGSPNSIQDQSFNVKYSETNGISHRSHETTFSQKKPAISAEPLTEPLSIDHSLTGRTSSQAKQPRDRLLPARPEQDVEPTGQQLVQQVVARVYGQRTIQARVRQRSWIYGQELIGAGEYFQSTTNGAVRLSFEVSIQSGRKLNVMQTINDGRYLWTVRTVLGKVETARVDTYRVHKLLQERQQLAPLAVGGLPALLQSLEKHFQFESPRSATLHKLPVWFVSGSRSQSLNNQIKSGQPKKKKKKPSAHLPHLPDHVSIVIGCDDFFPYRIEYFSQPTLAEDDETANRPILITEFYEVALGVKIDPLRFAFKPHNHPYTDKTDKFLSSLKAMSPEKSKTERVTLEKHNQRL